MFKLQDIKSILVPQYEELTANKMYSKVKGYIDNFSDYFPDMIKDISHQENIFGISSQLLIKSLLKSLLIILIRREKSRNSHKKAKEISEEIMNQINKKHFYSRQKKRAHSMLVASREVYKVNRKERICSIWSE